MDLYAHRRHLSFTYTSPTTTNNHHHHKSLIVATIKLKQIAVSVRNDLAMSVVIENSQLVATERSEEHTSELQSRLHLVCRLLLEKKKKKSTKKLNITS